MSDRFSVFIFIFAVVIFLQEIGGTYMISVIQSIERQFQIPSKLAGFMLSASDIGYIPTVIFISYFGSKGNRAKWIGSGTLLVSLCYIMISTPNFIFPVIRPTLNVTGVQKSLQPPQALVDANASLADYLAFGPIADRIPEQTRLRLLEKVVELHNAEHDGDIKHRNVLESIRDERQNASVPAYYTIDRPVMGQILKSIDRILHGQDDEEHLLGLLNLYATNRLNHSELDVTATRRAAIAPFSFCSKLVNDLKEAVKELRCERKASNLGPFIIIFTALVLLGIGRCTAWSLGMPLIDDNVKRKSSSLFFGGITLTRIMGPVCGFLVGSVANKLFFTFPAKAPSGLSPNDPTWIGAWWSGYLVIGLLGITPSLLLCFYPARGGKLFEGQKSLKFFDRHKVDDTTNNNKNDHASFVTNYRDVLASKIFLGSVIARVLDMFALKGYKAFLPKYVTAHYGLPQYKATTYVGICITFMFALGTVLGGIITRLTRMNGRKAALFIATVSTLNYMAFASKTLFGCTSVVSQIGETGQLTRFNYSNGCNMGCSCEGAQLYPVCDSTGLAYYSPCHAGCRDALVKNAEEHNLEFTNCDCVADGIGSVSKHFCHDDCSNMTILFFVFSAMGALIAGLGMVPGLLVLIRSVPPATRSIALGVHAFVISLLGTLPSPVIWGALIDSACLVWDKTCGKRGTCNIYDTEALRIKMHTIYVMIRIVAMFADLYVLYHSKGLNIQEEEEDESKNQPIETLQMHDVSPVE
ncbi:hypothetical protein L596_019811 [Steinernema carpocapsae]|uniref:Solute carrier organic anion transporter family member n=1 Tax=Steinernema carpocapsae TaxID=34508 RepID=A0A4U5MSH3_STECR|nr:hypothetical protein L596_019811 [Steinernema carpocapsae]